ncbi:hypothetical protein ACFVHQ_18550 [Actinomycetes bacterium NPDC127524]
MFSPIGVHIDGIALEQKKISPQAFFIATPSKIMQLLDGKVAHLPFALTTIGNNKLACYFEWRNFIWTKQFSLLVQAPGWGRGAAISLAKKGHRVIAATELTSQKLTFCGKQMTWNWI